ncbi:MULTISPECIES: hypothetical protein [Mesorhizobium]|uniref:hypothetical protein n=1 Tax=Mesorhizobium TaxID=68287 RepID=UPI0007A94127|nr:MULTISPECIES: hypothetical protein [Mesorhizobium]AMX93658.1 hypothetical protein A4R28_11390 [Mesorhizobium ciceri]MDF3208350.1 hypothetical protein [Mesorhizobium sp. LMG15046]MDF3229078.1 hypothetical protein [Mesorhizobium sp. DSM 30133]RUU22189.1 hypothetical protein EOC84_03500 [Mesorhizobium sp. Primo-B]RUU37901.1 hypothetical protein EOC83_16715 [Mesorhizobium sp. Primo-A]
MISVEWPKDSAPSFETWKKIAASFEATLAAKDTALAEMRVELERMQKEVGAADADRSAARAGQQVAAIRAKAAEADLARARKALETADAAIAEYVRYLDGGQMRGSYDGKPERDGLRKAGYIVRAAIGPAP